MQAARRDNAEPLGPPGHADTCGLTRSGRPTLAGAVPPTERAGAQSAKAQATARTKSSNAPGEAGTAGRHKDPRREVRPQANGLRACRGARKRAPHHPPNGPGRDPRRRRRRHAPSPATNLEEPAQPDVARIHAGKSVLRPTAYELAAEPENGRRTAKPGALHSKSAARNRTCPPPPCFHIHAPDDTRRCHASSLDSSPPPPDAAEPSGRPSRTRWGRTPAQVPRESQLVVFFVRRLPSVPHYTRISRDESDIRSTVRGHRHPTAATLDVEGTTHRPSRRHTRPRPRCGDGYPSAPRDPPPLPRRPRPTSDGLRRGKNAKRPFVLSRTGAPQLMLAATYSPTQSPVQYHRRRKA